MRDVFCDKCVPSQDNDKMMCVRCRFCTNLSAYFTEDGQQKDGAMCELLGEVRAPLKRKLREDEIETILANTASFLSRQQDAVREIMRLEAVK